MSLNQQYWTSAGGGKGLPCGLSLDLYGGGVGFIPIRTATHLQESSEGVQKRGTSAFGVIPTKAGIQVSPLSSSDRSLVIPAKAGIH
jgi:hypothetical protein